MGMNRIRREDEARAWPMTDIPELLMSMEMKYPRPTRLVCCRHGDKRDEGLDVCWSVCPASHLVHLRRPK